jgi:dipeptidyl aminopeptidase/acylaminoacyl peptidase
VRLTSDAARDVGPAFSADGTRIAYFRQQGTDQNQRALRVVNVDGSSDVEIVADADHEVLGSLDWSPDGARIALLADPQSTANDSGIYVVDADGTNLTAVSVDDVAGERNYYVTWSPDGQRLAISRRVASSAFNIHLFNPDGTGETRLTNSSEQSYGLDWAPDGATIAFYNGTNDIRTVRVADGVLATVRASGGTIGGLSWQSIPRAPLATTGVGVERDADLGDAERVGELAVDGVYGHHRVLRVRHVDGVRVADGRGPGAADGVRHRVRGRPERAGGRDGVPLPDRGAQRDGDDDRRRQRVPDRGAHRGPDPDHPRLRPRPSCRRRSSSR